MTAPTSALARPKPASTAVDSPNRPSHSTVDTARAGPIPNEASCSRYSSHRSDVIRCASEAMMGNTKTIWAMIIAVGVNNSPNTPNGPERDSSR